jgi:hypothetical protein
MSAGPKTEQITWHPIASFTKPATLATQLQEKLDFVVVLRAKGLKLGKLANICHFAYKLPVCHGLNGQ